MTINAARKIISLTGPNCSFANSNACRKSITQGNRIELNITVTGWGQEINAGGTITGPAPFAVFCDATATNHTVKDSFRELGYHWDFGYATPATPGTWAVSGQNKGNEVGRRPIAAHVYESAGTFAASVRVQDSNNNRADATVTIIVQDPETYWTTSGRSTVTIGAGDAMPTWADNTRYLFQCGVNYSAKSVTAINSRFNICLAATGSGAKPIMPALTLESASWTTRTWSNNVIFDSLDLRAGFSSELPCSHILLYKCETKSMEWGSEIDYRWADGPSATQPTGWYRPKFITQYECTHDALSASSSYAMLTKGNRHAVLGCTFKNSGFHNVRFGGFYKVFFAHNQSFKCGSNVANTTFRALSVDTAYGDWDSTVARTTASRYLVASYNSIGSVDDTTNNAAMTIKPQNETESEGIEDAIVDGNTNARIGGGGWSAVGRRVTEAENAFASYSVDTTQGTAATPAEWFGPYYTNNATADGVLIFAAPTKISPNKAGT